MIALSMLIEQFGEAVIEQYGHRLLPSQRKGLKDMGRCRNHLSPLAMAACEGCDHSLELPHSCGHRNCPHCQHHESQQWLERQLEKRIAAEYFMITFTLPREFRSLAWSHQRVVYQAMMGCAWETLRRFSEHDRQLQGTPGAIAVLHTQARNLDYHPHVHMVIPAAAVDEAKGCWRTKRFEGKKRYLFNHTALAKVFRAKLLETLSNEGLTLPKTYPEKWVVDCRSVGTGAPALTYLGRYLYRGVIQEKDIVACKAGKVTYRWQDNKTQAMLYKTVDGAEFLWRILQHILPKRFRRARNFGFLHPNAKRLYQIIKALQPLGKRGFSNYKKERPTLNCPCCGGIMVFFRFRIQRADYGKQLALV